MVNNKFYSKNKSTQRGFTLIEVMIALLILSVGMLGVAGMQTRSLQSGSLATQRLTVIMKAQEIAERIRINAAEVGSYNFSTAASGTNNACYNGTNCTPAQLAEYDFYLWKQDLLSVLPNDASTTLASVTVVPPSTSVAATATTPLIPAVPLTTVIITISWQSSAGAQSYTSTFQVDQNITVQG